MAGELGKASLDLEANLAGFTANIKEGERVSGGLRDQLSALADISTIATAQLNRVKMSAGQGSESKVSAEAIISGVRGISDESRTAARELDRVKLTEAQATESDLAGDRIKGNLDEIGDKADQTKRKLAEVKLGSMIGGTSVPILGAAIGAGVLAAPALAPGAAGLLAAIPVLAGSAVGALGALMLAFDGVGKAIKGDKKAFDDLGPAAKQFVLTVRSLDGWFDKLRQTAAANLFPGLTAGLRAALSPGTVTALTDAVAAFARVIGAAGAAWGRYFGSPEFQHIFGPLMQDGARNLGVMADAALSLFDALGVLARAAIPLVNWLVDAADRGAQLVDSWLHAKDASGQLAHGMREAQTSLKLVGGLVVALLKVVGALGQALYPLSTVALKALTGGLSALAGWIHRNQKVIRELVGGALKDLIAVVKLAVTVISDLYGAIRHKLGKATRDVIIALGAAIAIALGPESVAIGGAIIAVGELIRHWQTVKRWFTDFGHFLINVFEAAWKAVQGITDLAIYGLLAQFDLLLKAIAGAVGHIPFIGSSIKHALEAAAGYIDQFRTQGISYLQASGSEMGSAWGSAFDVQISAALARALNKMGAVRVGPSGGPKTLPPGTGTFSGTQSDVPTEQPPKPITFTGGGADPWVFGPPPPFTSNLGPKKKKPPAAPLMPALAAHALALASADASRAQVLGNVGGTAKRYLEHELADLETAAKSIRAKYLHTTGKVHTELFAALTRVLNQERKVRKQIAAAIKSNRAAALAFAVEQAKLAVENAKEGSSAWDRAVAAEEKALKAEIAYYDKLAHNRKLSLAVRKAALAAELRDVKELKALMKPQTAGAAGANEAQFLSSFAQIVSAYAPNSNPATPAAGGKTDTHLYDIKHELRRQTPLLKRAVRQSAFPGSGYTTASATAATG